LWEHGRRRLAVGRLTFPAIRLPAGLTQLEFDLFAPQQTVVVRHSDNQRVRFVPKDALPLCRPILCKRQQSDRNSKTTGDSKEP
jgi:hypothetical protein